MRLRPREIIAGYTTTEGTDPIVLSGGPADVRQIVGTMDAGEMGYFYMKYQDGRAGYAEFRATFDGVDTLTVDEVLLTDPALGDPPNWLTGVKEVRRILSEREILSAARVYQDKPLHHPIIVLGFGDSNAYGAGAANEPMLVNNLIDDWTNKDAASFRLRVPDPNRPLWTPTVNPHTGYIEGNVGNSIWAHSDYISRELNRQVVIVMITAPGETAEYFRPGNAGGNEIKVQWDAALVAIRTKFGDNSITYADDVLIHLGTNDASQGRTPKQFAADMHAIMRALYDPNQWGITNRRTSRTFLFDLPHHRNETVFHFNGVHLFDSQTDENVSVIGTERTRQFDPVHHTGDDNNALGRASARARLHEAAPKSRGGAFSVRRSSRLFSAEYEIKSDSASPPSADGDARFNPVAGELMVRKVDNLAATHELDQLLDYDRLSFVDQGNAANYEEYLLQSTPADGGNHYTWEATLIDSGGVLADNTICDVYAGPAAQGWGKYVFDGQEDVAHTTMPIQSDALAGVGNKLSYQDPDGVTKRSSIELEEPNWYEFITNGSAAIHVGLGADGSRIEAEYVLVGQRDSSEETARAEIQLCNGRTGGSGTGYQEVRAIAPGHVAIAVAFISGGWWVTMNGTGRWSWTLREVIRDIPYVPDP